MIFSKENFKTEVEDYAGLVLVDFFATWCGPCQIMAPVIEEMANENKEPNLKIGKLNIDENQDIASKYGVMSIPNFLLFKNGKVVGQQVGYCAKEDLQELINNNK